MEKQVSGKNTKNEILEAYEQLLKEVQANKSGDTKKQAEQEQKQKTVEKAASHSNEDIVKNIANLKVMLNGSLDKLEDNLLKEFRKFTEVKEAIESEEQRLKDVYEIHVNIDSLEALLLAQKEKKVQFETEMNEKRQTFETEMAATREKWEREKKQWEQTFKEQKEQKEKERKREEEEYTYNLKLQRKKEEDDYNHRRQMQEQELAEKEKEWKEKESEYQELKKQVAEHPAQLEEAVKKAREEVTNTLTTQYNYEKDLYQKEINGDIKLYQQTIKNLETKISEQNKLIDQLTQKADLSSDQVKEIAMKALEGSATKYYNYKQEESKNKNAGDV